MSIADFPDALVDMLRRASNVVFLTGAGVSAESGIPTFRDPMTGLWAQYDPMSLACAQAYRRDRELVWGWYEWRRMGVLRARPNGAHLAIAGIEGHETGLDFLGGGFAHDVDAPGIARRHQRLRCRSQTGWCPGCRHRPAVRC